MDYSRSEILNEIRRTARANGGTPLGIKRFCDVTEIPMEKILGVYWARWSDACIAAGFSPNTLPRKYSRRHLLRRYAALTLQLGRIPTFDDLKLHRRSDPSMPSPTGYLRHFRTLKDLRDELAGFCEKYGEFADVIPLLREWEARKYPSPPAEEDDDVS